MSLDSDDVLLYDRQHMMEIDYLFGNSSFATLQINTYIIMCITHGLEL